MCQYPVEDLMGIKVAVIGGGSTYTPELVEGLANRRARLPIDELVLHDIDATRREIVGGLAGRMLRRMEWDGRLTLTGDTEAAVADADFVLIQLRIGGQAARLLDETLPLRFGTIGQETTGAGGFAKALRTVPIILELAELARRHAAPGAWIIDFTNPVGIVSQALADEGHRALGLCNVAISLQRRLAGFLEVDPDRLVLDHVGLNHLSWITAAKVDGVDRLPELLAEHGATIAGDLKLPVERVRELGAVPSYYLRYYYAFDEVLAEQRNGHSRAEEVMGLESRLLDMYADPSLDTKPALLNDRGGAFYSEAAAQLLASLHDGAGDVQVVDVRNGDAVPGLAADDVVEVPARIDRDGAQPLSQAPMSPEMLSLVRAAKEYERLAVRAAKSGAREDARLALEANPLVGPRIGDVTPLLDALLEANQAHLPQFATG
jgi:6-phospho-beta-glucosidase